MGILSKKKGGPVVMWPTDVEIDVHMDAETGDYLDAVRFTQEGSDDIIIYVKHGMFRNLAVQLDSAKADLFP